MLGWILLGLLSVDATAPPGPDAFGYTVLPTTNFSFLQITNVLSGSKRVLWFDDDTAFTVTNIGFNFSFYGTNYTSVSFNVNGLMTFGGTTEDPANVNLSTSSPTNNKPSIAVLWDDWETIYYGNEDAVYYRTLGNIGSRQLVVQWNRVDPIYGPGIDPVTFEVRLFEGSGQILFSYLDTVVSDDATNPPLASFGIGATVGIRDTSGQSNGRNLQWSFNQGIITNGLHLLFVPTNHPPSLTNDTLVIAEDGQGTVAMLANDGDAEGDPLTVVAITQGTNGSVALNPNGTATYVPGTNFFGADFFTYAVTEARGGISTGFVNVTVTSVNDIPVAQGDSSSTLEDTPVLIQPLSNDTDADSDTLTIIEASCPDGAAQISGGTNLFFIPATNFNGVATILHTITDGNGGFATGVVTVVVSPVNDVPDISTIPDVTNTAGEPLADLHFTVTDPETPAESLILALESDNPTLLPTNNIIIGGVSTNRTLTLSPVSNQFGIATIKIIATDPEGATNSASFSLTINSRPMISAIADQIIDEDSATGVIGFQIGDAETPAGSLTVSAISSNLALLPTNHISLGGSLSNRTVTLTPAANRSGSATVTLTVADTNGGTASSSFTLTVNEINDLPTMTPFVDLTNDEDIVTGPVDFTISDVETSASNLVMTASSTNTVLLPVANIEFAGTLTNRTLTLHPATNQFGESWITITVTDQDGGAATNSFLFVVNPVNDPPVAVADIANMPEDSQIVLSPLDNDFDPEGDPFQILSASNTNGTVTVLSGTNILFEPDTNFFGTAWITYTIGDGIGGSATSTIEVAVAGINDAPVALHSAAGVVEDRPTLLDPLENDYDPDGDVLTITGVVFTNGLVTIVGGTNLLYVPPTNFTGLLWVFYTISDGHGGTSEAGVNVIVVARNDAPVANDDVAVTAEDTPVLLDPLANDSDVEDGLPIIEFAIASAGSITNLGGTNLLYTPPPDFNGIATVHYGVHDSAGETASAQITITVTPVNDPPAVADDYAECCKNFSLQLSSASLLVNDRNVDGPGALSVTNWSPASTAGGTVTFASGDFTYSPPTNFTGPDSFTYTVVDTEGDPATATVHVQVGAPLYLMSITAQTNGAMLLRACGEHGSNYQMQATSDFISWTNLGALSNGAFGGLEFMDVTTSASPIRFYRVASP